MPSLPFVYFQRSTALTPGKRAIFILLQYICQVIFLMNFRMSNIPIQNIALFYICLYLILFRNMQYKHKSLDAFQTSILVQQLETSYFAELGLKFFQQYSQGTFRPAGSLSTRSIQVTSPEQFSLSSAMISQYCVQPSPPGFVHFPDSSLT